MRVSDSKSRSVAIAELHRSPANRAAISARVPTRPHDQAGRAFAAGDDAKLGRRHEPRQHQRRFPAPGCADDGHHRSGFDRPQEPCDDLLAPEIAVCVGRFDRLQAGVWLDPFERVVRLGRRDTGVRREARFEDLADSVAEEIEPADSTIHSLRFGAKLVRTELGHDSGVGWDARDAPRSLTNGSSACGKQASVQTDGTRPVRCLP